jgi:hypothetical protein
MMPPPVALGLKPGGNVTVVVIADQFNPPRTYQFPVDKIEAVHPVIAIAPVDSDLAVPIAD